MMISFMIGLLLQLLFANLENILAISDNEWIVIQFCILLVDNFIQGMFHMTEECITRWLAMPFSKVDLHDSFFVSGHLCERALAFELC